MTDDATLVEETDADIAELADELFRVAEDTTADGRVRVEIQELNKRAGGEEIEVRARLPSQREFIERMAYPERDDTEYKFVRLCRAAGYSLAAAEQLDGATVEAEQDDDGEWVLCAPENKSFNERMLARFEAAYKAGGVLFVIAFLPVFAAGAVLFDDHDSGLAEDIGVLVMSFVIWFALVVAFDQFVLIEPATGPVEVPI